MKIVIDAGHGFETPGKRCPDDSMREYAFNRAVANYAAAFLREFQDVEVKFTHSDARDVPLQERTNTANAWGADVFVSVHANALGAGWNDGCGIETFTYVTCSPASVKLATAVQAELVARTGRKSRGVKAENFHVLRETNMTAILAECGFMTNKNEAELLKSEDYRRTCAEAIVAALAKVYRLTATKVSPAPVPDPAPKPVNPVDEVPAWALDAVKAGMAKGAFNTPNGSDDFYRFVTILNNLGLFK